MFRERIREKYDSLTPSFCKLADFVLQNQLDAAFMTATELANRLEVDAATVVRFAQELGYSGFRELSKEVQEIVRSELKASYSTDLNAPTDLELFRGLLGREQHNLTLAQDRMTEQINTILPALLEADRIWVLGQSHAVHLAGLCASVLRELGLNALSIVADPMEVAANLKEVGSDELVMGFSLAEVELGTASAINFAREQGAKTIVFSASPVASAALEAETTIVCPGANETGGMPSFTGLAAMIVVFASAFEARHPSEAQAMSDDFQDGYYNLLKLQRERVSGLDIEES